MTMFKCSYLFVLLLAGWPAQSSGASLEQLTSKADLVVIGSAVPTYITATETRFILTPKRLLKNSSPAPAPSGFDLSYQTARKILGTYPGENTSQISTSVEGMWFLVKSGSGTWSALQARSSINGLLTDLCLPALNTALVFPAQFTNLALSDTLMLEVAAGVEAQKVQPEIMINVIGPSWSEITNFIATEYLGSTDPRHVSVGLSLMLSHGVSGSIKTVMDKWLRVKDDSSRTLVTLAINDMWRDSSPGGVADLVALARSSMIDLRKSSVIALSSIHTRETLPFLSTLLESANPAEQVRGGIGLSSFANGCSIQTPLNTVSMEYLRCNGPTAYRTQDTVAHSGFRSGSILQNQQFVAYWRSWWGNHAELH